METSTSKRFWGKQNRIGAMSKGNVQRTLRHLRQNTKNDVIRQMRHVIQELVQRSGEFVIQNEDLRHSCALGGLHILEKTLHSRN